MLYNFSDHTGTAMLRLQLTFQCHFLESYFCGVYPGGLKSLKFVRHNLTFHVVYIVIIFGCTEKYFA
jgi:hypothetical protein